MRRGLVLYNPAAGRLDVRWFLPGLLRSLSAEGWRMEAAETLSSGHATRIAHRAAEEKFDAVFAIGGDGTVGQVAAGLMGTDTALAILPAGTTNVLARELGMPAFEWHRPWAMNSNARKLANSPVQQVDVGLCNDQPFLLWAGIGLDALAIHRIEPRWRLAKYVSVPHFFASTVWEAAFWNGMDLQVRTDGRQAEGHFILAVATNIRRYVGGLAVLSPQALLDDGEMDLWLFGGAHLADALRHLLDMLGGRHLSSEQARCLPFRSARIESRLPFSLQMDGEPMLGGAQVELTIRPRALKVLMPAGASQLLKHPVNL